MTTTYKELQKHYEQWLSSLGFSPSIIYNYPKMLSFFLNYLEQKGIYQINLITSKHIQSYYLHLQSRQNLITGGALSIAHLNKHFDCIDKFIECLNQYQANIEITPLKYRIYQTKYETVEAISKEEIKLLYQSIDNLFSRLTMKEAEPRKAVATLILDLCYGLGLRRSEAYHLEIKNINFEHKTAHIVQGKNYKDRIVPINDTIIKRLELFIYQYRRHFKVNHTRLFPLQESSLPKYLLKIINQSELENKNISLHTLRHSIATHLLQNGMSVEQISKFLGHSSLESTQIYTHLISEN
jgi:integrase/recombinase XerD